MPEVPRGRKWITSPEGPRRLIEVEADGTPVPPAREDSRLEALRAIAADLGYDLVRKSGTMVNSEAPRSFSSKRVRMTCPLCGNEGMCLVIPESHHINTNDLTGMYNLQEPTGWWKCPGYGGCGKTFHAKMRRM